MDIDMDIDMGVGMDMLVDDGEAEMAENILPSNGAVASSQPQQRQPSDVPQSQAAAASGSGSDADTQLAPHKVHVRGLDQLRTADIRRWTAEHFAVSEPERIEWIDDSSANLVYADADTAARALASLTQGEMAPEQHQQQSLSQPQAPLHASAHLSAMIPATQLRRAKPLSTSPDTLLEVRVALLQDRKQPGARERSRFYLLNPDDDPGERREREARAGRQGTRRRARTVADGSGGAGDRWRPGDRYADYQRRRSSEQEDGTGQFSADMYDDGPDRGREGRERHSSPTGAADAGATAVTASARELFPGRVSRKRDRQRDRSASPAVDRDDDTMDVDTDDARAKRQRRFRERSTPPPPPSQRRRRRNGRSANGLAAGTHAPPLAGANAGGTAASRLNGAASSAPRDVSAELRGFGSANAAAAAAATPSKGGTKELFPQKLRARLHRRSDAFDAASEPADLFTGRLSVPFTDGAADSAAPAVTVRGRSRRSNGRLEMARATDDDVDDHDDKDDNDFDEGYDDRYDNADRDGDGDANLGAEHQQQQPPPAEFSIRGMAAATAAAGSATRKQRQDDAAHLGFSIRGAATASNAGPVIAASAATMKSGLNIGKELFAEKLQGRGGRRRRAEDMMF